MIGARALDHWRNRPARERWLLGLPALALLVVALYIGVWEPLRASTARLSGQLPEMEARRERIRVQTAELRGQPGAPNATGAPSTPSMPSTPSTPSTPAARAASASVVQTQILAAIDRQQMRGAAPAIDRSGDSTDRVRLVFPRVAFHAVWPLLQDLQKTSGIRVIALRVDRIDAANARFEASLGAADARSR